MMLRAAAVAFAALFVAVAALASLAGAAGPRRYVLNGEIGAMSASGTKVAIVGGSGNCGSALVWNASTGAVVKLKDPCSSDAVYQDLTLAGGTAVWWDFSSGNHVYCDDVYANDHPLGICDGTMGDTYFEFAGDSSIVAVADYSVCEADCTDANGTLLPDGDYGVEVGRLVGREVVPVLKPVNFRTFLDARNWRVAVIEPKAVLTLYDSSGRRLWSVPGVTGVAGGWITGGAVVLKQRGAIRVYSAVGAGSSRPLPKGAQVEGVVGGLVLYRIGPLIRVLRLRDGRDRMLVKNIGMLGAQLTPAGVFYAAGRAVTFVPIGTVLRKLR